MSWDFKQKKHLQRAKAVAGAFLLFSLAELKNQLYRLSLEIDAGKGVK
ncbi:hypothetical protein NYE70_03380 [Paenibacillus sp. FSL R5-0407]